MPDLALADVLARVEEFSSRPREWGSLPDQLEAALYVEEVFGVRLADDEICPATLGSAEALERFVLRRLGMEMNRCAGSAASTT